MEGDRMTTLDERFKAANRPVRVTLSVPAATLLRLEGLAAQLEITVQEAFEEAVGDWVVRREHSGNRQDRLALQQALRDAKDQAPVRDLLDRFRAQMEGTEEGFELGLVERESVVSRKSSEEALTAPAREAKVPHMGQPTVLRKDIGERIEQRRHALEMSRETLGAAAGGIASSTVHRVERGLVKAHPRTIAALTQALDRAEQEAAAA